jgi:hypothetical protein
MEGEYYMGAPIETVKSVTCNRNEWGGLGCDVYTSERRETTIAYRMSAEDPIKIHDLNDVEFHDSPQVSNRLDPSGYDVLSADYDGESFCTVLSKVDYRLLKCWSDI